jgi:hypothetical protein
MFLPPVVPERILPILIAVISSCHSSARSVSSGLAVGCTFILDEKGDYFSCLQPEPAEEKGDTKIKNAPKKMSVRQSGAKVPQRGSEVGCFFYSCFFSCLC